ncbi:MAG: anthranilate phosphoribosyltransferase, partial [Lysobacterales bacterium]
NAAAALYVAGVSNSIAEGLSGARRVINDGSAWRRLNKLAKLTGSFVD